MEPITVIIGGDLAPTQTNCSYFSEGNLSVLIDEKLLSLLNSADYRIFNLPVFRVFIKSYFRKFTINGR